MIKEGQIFKIDEEVLVITKTYKRLPRFDCIYKDGETNDWSYEFLEKYGELIAEYPTWQEAVNSAEFRGEAR